MMILLGIIYVGDFHVRLVKRAKNFLNSTQIYLQIMNSKNVISRHYTLGFPEGRKNIQHFLRDAICFTWYTAKGYWK